MVVGVNALFKPIELAFKENNVAKAVAKLFNSEKSFILRLELAHLSGLRSRSQKFPI